jgi:Domain of unknown function (DUF4124)
MLRPAIMLRSLTLTTLIFTGLSGVAHADVYRWVDDHGEPHYTDRWVPGSELIKSSKPRPSVDSPAPAQTQARTAVPSGNQTEAAKQEKANEAAVKSDVAKTKEAQCKQAKDRYQKAIEARRIYKPGKDAEERVYMTDAESDKYRADARNDVTLTCGSPPPAAQPAEPAQPAE